MLAVQPPGDAARRPDPRVPLGAGDRLTVAGPATVVQALRSGIEPEPAPATVAR